MKWIAAASIVIAIAAGVFAYTRDQAANAATAQIAALKEEAQKAQAASKAAQAERDALRKETDELKRAAEEARSAAEVATKFFEAEKGVSAKLREDLAMTTARLAAAVAAARQPRGAERFPPGVIPPGLAPIQPPPFVVRAAPGNAPVSAAAPAAFAPAGAAAR
ncbi:MAG: hypothetical protein ACKVQK_21760 [Burkholderiales bacterium]